MSVYQEMATAMPHDPDQRQAGDGGDPGVLRLLAALAVHGSDQPAVRGHAQAPAVGPRAGGLSRERAGFEVRDVHPTQLRPDLPDRDAGGPEHRPDLVAGVLRADQRVRLHRVALPEGEGREDRRLRGHHQRRDEASTRSATSSCSRTSSRMSAGKRRAKEGHEYEPYPFYLSAGRRTSTSSPQANVTVGEEGKPSRTG